MFVLVVFHLHDWASILCMGCLKDFLHLSIKACLNLLGYRQVFIHIETPKKTYTATCNIYQKLGQLIVLGTFTASTKTPCCFWCYMVILRHCHHLCSRGNEVSLMAGRGQLWVSQQGSKTLRVSNNRHSLKPVIFPCPPIIIYQHSPIYLEWVLNIKKINTHY